MSQVDLRPLLKEWPHDPEQVSVRKIVGADGVERLQMRVELGVLQMEVDGRPDGERPFGYTSLLEYHQNRLARHETGSDASFGFCLSSAECRALRVEASQYYRRYVAFFVLEEYANVARDTAHNLALFELCRQYGAAQEDRLCVEAYLPYVWMMSSRAQALQAKEEGHPVSALAHVNRGILQLKSHFLAVGQPESAERSEELRILRNLASELSAQVSTDTAVGARRELRRAIAQERFEDAARLRDAIRNRQQSARRD